jgi:hypothetical protein
VNQTLPRHQLTIPCEIDPLERVSSPLRWLVEEETTMPDNDYQDDQEQSETFDETHLDDEGDGEFCWMRPIRCWT